jgi:RNA polymerase sigma-70 factor (ECF subfamily)
LNPSDPRTDEQLADAVVEGDFGAFELLVRRYTHKVYRLAWSYVKSDHEAEDVMQETFINVYRALPRFEGKSKLGSWIYRVTVNTALMRLRRKRRRPEVSIEGSRPEDSTGSERESPFLIERRTAADDLSAMELRGEIQASVDSLEDKYRVVFLLRDVEGLSIQETAEALEISVPAVKSRLHRARLFLRASLERYVTS